MGAFITLRGPIMSRPSVSSKAGQPSLLRLAWRPGPQFLGSSCAQAAWACWHQTVITRGGVLACGFFSSRWDAAGESASAPLNYGRFHNLTWTYYEQALSELEGGPAITFTSGMAAVAAVFGIVLRPGDVVVLPSDSYYTTRVIADGYFTQ